VSRMPEGIKDKLKIEINRREQWDLYLLLLA
jgi:hypothetical protein